jgi:polysaccharide deacetylase
VIRPALAGAAVRALGVGLAATGISVPGAAYWWAGQPRVYGISPQMDVSIPVTTPLPVALSYRSGVLVLCYHDLSPRPHNVYTVTPRAFAAQMAALHALGYHAVGLERTVGYLTGRAGPLPPRAVLITFDDGTKSTWIYADSILRRLGMRAAVMLITGDVSQHQPYYLDWAEVAAMQASGRFEFGGHTRAGHGLIPAGGGRDGPFLTERKWLSSEGRLETIDEYRARVAADWTGRWPTSQPTGCLALTRSHIPSRRTGSRRTTRPCRGSSTRSWWRDSWCGSTTRRPPPGSSGA